MSTCTAVTPCYYTKYVIQAIDSFKASERNKMGKGSVTNVV